MVQVSLELAKDPSLHSLPAHLETQKNRSRKVTVNYEEIYQEKLENNYYVFLQEMDEAVDEELVYYVLQSHGRLNEYLEFAKLTVALESISLG